MAEIEAITASPGALLSKARKNIGLSKPDIARQLNLSLKLIGQLESDQYTNDIPDAFLRGYIRTYARLVDIDEEEIVLLYSELTGSTGVSNSYDPLVDVPAVKIQVGSHLLWFKLLSCAVFIGMLILGWLALREKSEAKVLGDITRTQQQMSRYAVVAKTSSQQITPMQSVQQVRVEIPRGFVDDPVLTDATLEFTFIDDCWVQVIDSNSEVLAVGLKTAGRRFTVSGVPPISVVLGKPRAISLQYNNQAVDLSSYPSSQTARFSLGNASASEDLVADTVQE